MSDSLFHVLYKKPALEKEEMFQEQEELARALVESGKVRVDAEEKINFVRFTLPYQKINLMFSKRELTNKNLLPRTEATISKLLSAKYRGADLKHAVKGEINRLRKELSKYQPVSAELEMKLIRIVVQCAHPVVIRLLLWEQAEIFVSYSYNIGDLLDIKGWKESGQNSGMQSTNGYDVNIYISAGGDPFAKAEEGTVYGNGFPAIARMMIIGGQEIGHYSDIIHDKNGRQISRHSADFAGTRAKENVRIARIDDMQACRRMLNDMNQMGLGYLEERERYIKFFIRNKRGGMVLWVEYIKHMVFKRIFLSRVRQKKSLQFVIGLTNDKYLASKLIAMIKDSLVNLDPKADVYSHPDPVVEEAISCIEALARVPQQVMKWGHEANSYLMPNLYQIYYKQVIPSCIATYENVSGKKYIDKLTKGKKSWLYLLKKIFNKDIFKKKEKVTLSWEL